MKNTKKVILFLAIFILLLLIGSVIFVPRNNLATFGVRNARANRILGERKDSLDAIFLGDSLVYSSINPMVIWEKYGYATYDLAISAQYLYESYANLSKSLENQQPKILFLETNQFFRKYKVINIIGAEGKKMFPLFEYHNRWKSLSLKDIFHTKDYSLRDPLKGFRHMEKINAPDKVDKYYMNKKKDIEISKINYRYIKKIIELCQDNDIEVVLLSTPSMKNCNYSKYLAIKDIAEYYNLAHIDLNLDVNLGIDWYTETIDKGDHLNMSGANKVSNYLGEYMSSRGFTDHRDEEAYQDWRDDFLEYKEQIKKDNN